jgi:uncharacterized protein (TIGR02284 family)
MADGEVIDTLNTLIETSRDAENGFHAAAEVVDDPSLRRLFAAYSRQRGEFAHELEAHVRRLGGTPQQSGSVAGTLHRAVLNIRAAVSGPDERAVIAEAERGEDAALRAYEAALRRSALPADLRAVIVRQAGRVKEAQDRLRDLKRAA